MVPGQSTEELSQRSQAMAAGEDEERSGRSRLPAAAGKEAGAVPALGQQQLHMAQARGWGRTKPRHSRDMPSPRLNLQEGNI